MVKKLLKGKLWFNIIAPEIFGSKIIGEGLAHEPSVLIGRVIETSLTELTGNLTRYYVKLRFRIVSVNEVAHTKFDGHECTRDFITRIVQHRRTRVDTNDVFQFKDGKMRIKSIAMCNRRVSQSIASAVRRKISELIASEVKGKSIDEFALAFCKGELQEKIKKEVNKIYPLRAFEIRKTEVLEV